jgi:uncharacterized membrane protein (UPF0127 family)
MTWQRLILISLLMMARTSLAETPYQDNGTITADLQGHEFVLELKLTDKSRAKGMGGRTEVPEGTGMLFVYPTERALRFWMKDCLIPLDIAFLNAQGEILVVGTMPTEPDPANPQKLYGHPEPGQFAIEMGANEMKKIGLERGDRIELPWEALVGAAK